MCFGEIKKFGSCGKIVLQYTIQQSWIFFSSILSVQKRIISTKKSAETCSDCKVSSHVNYSSGNFCTLWSIGPVVLFYGRVFGFYLRAHQKQADILAACIFFYFMKGCELYQSGYCIVSITRSPLETQPNKFFNFCLRVSIPLEIGLSGPLYIYQYSHILYPITLNTQKKPAISTTVSLNLYSKRNENIMI